MACNNDNCNDFIETEQGRVPVTTALELLRFYYQADILLGLYDYAAQHQDQRILSQIRGIRKQRLGSRQAGPVASPGNLPRRVAAGCRGREADTPELNYFAPTKILQEMLKEDWFVDVRCKDDYDEQWTDAFIEALMSSPWKDAIAAAWSVNGKRNKHTQIKGYIVGLLTDAEVLKGSYDSIARKINPEDETRSFSRYMSQGKRQKYAEWVMEYVKVEEA